jgi:murein DD-endopeptidase MepM/ murein hydrolase activator NlpD
LILKGLVGEALYTQYNGVITDVQDEDLDSRGKYVQMECTVITSEGSAITIQFTYMHLNTIAVTEGQSVNNRTPFATLGATGNASGDDVPNKHVHIEARIKYYNGTISSRVDPEDYMATQFDADGNPIPCDTDATPSRYIEK